MMTMANYNGESGQYNDKDNWPKLTCQSNSMREVDRPSIIFCLPVRNQFATKK